MATAAKLAANRANATHSTGPADTSRTRFNGVSHGLTSKQTVIAGESQDEYDGFEASMRADLAPASAIETVLADRIIAAAWRLKRFTRMEAAFFNNRIEAFLENNPDSDPDAALANLFTDPAEAARLRLFLRYQTTVQREYDTAMREFHKAKAERVRDSFEQAYVASVTANTQRLTQESKPAIATPKATTPPVGFASQNTEQSAQQATTANVSNSIAA